MELIGIALVVVVSVASAWWTGSEFSVDLRGVSATAQSFAPARANPQHRIVGYTGQQEASRDQDTSSER